jgi:hypothetical protein
MSTKRTRINRSPRSRITPAAIAIFKRGLEIEETGADKVWEHAGGRRREYLDLGVELSSELGLSPWDEDIFDVADDVPEWMTDPRQIEKELAAIALRKALLAAIEESDSMTK